MTTPTPCHGEDRKAYRFAMRHDVFAICDECAEYLTRAGLTLIPVERRTRAVPVVKERRRFVPRWLRGLTAREMTERAA